MTDTYRIDLPQPLVTALEQAGMPIPKTTAEAERILEMLYSPPSPPKGHGSLSGEDLVKDPDGALQAFRAAGGTDDQLVRWYLSGDSPVHLLRTGGQPQMLQAALRSMVPTLSREIAKEAGVDGVGAMLLAEQVAEARCDESYLRTLQGIALDKNELAKAERYEKMANRASRRMMDALERLHRPKVNVKIGRAANVNLGEQRVVNESVDRPGTRRRVRQRAEEGRTR